MAEEASDVPVVVFQCKTCSAIVGDSMNILHLSEPNRTVTLQCVINVNRSAVPIYSTQGDDAGNTYHELMCRQCKRILGRWYSATLPQFDAYRMAYTLNADDVVEYHVGMTTPVEEWRMDGALAVADWMNKMETVDDLSKRMEKVRKVLLVVEERLVESKRRVDQKKRGMSYHLGRTNAHSVVYCFSKEETQAVISKETSPAWQTKVIIQSS
ncbi:hypothetical protein AeRB84_017441 [Aphanomyces euteiches]|nr:hypothetical protein AeRB84_017441 [Aphanomyces euteiches]